MHIPKAHVTAPYSRLFSAGVATALLLGVSATAGNTAPNSTARTVTGTVSASVSATGSTASTQRATALSVARLSTTPKRYSKLFVDPQGSAVNAAKAARASGNTSTAKKLEVISKTAQARWFGDWNSVSTVKSEVSKYTKAANKAKARPTMVLYAIPGRDCGQYSSGGFNAATYKKWVAKVAAGFNGSKPIVILEPDSLAQDCGDGTRDALLKYAAKKLTKAGAWVYLDGGHSNWRTPTEMAKRLKKAGISNARGFATNVSNYNVTSKEKAYAKKVSTALKKLKVTSAHRNYVVDTSRNGKASSSSEWCNRPGAGLGKKPKLYNDSTALDGLLWIKRPGEADGTCNGGPNAGEWWQSYALNLVKNRAK